MTEGLRHTRGMTRLVGLSLVHATPITARARLSRGAAFLLGVAVGVTISVAAGMALVVMMTQAMRVGP